MRVRVVGLRQLRRASNLTLAQLAQKLGYSPDYVWRVETGRRSPSVALVVLLAQIFGSIELQSAEATCAVQHQRAHHRL